MIFRNLLQKLDTDIQEVLDNSGPRFLEIIENLLKSSEESLIDNTLYVLSCIASGNSKHKKIVLEDRYLLRAFELLKTTESSSIKIAAINLMLNLVYKESDQLGDSKARKHVIDLGLIEVLESMRKKENDPNVKGNIDRLLRKIV